MNLEHSIIAFIGPGVMAEAIISGLIREQVAIAENMIASGPRQARTEQLQDLYGIIPHSDNAGAAKSADVVVLAVKPQQIDIVLEGLSGAIKPDALVLSIVAGATIRKISKGLKHAKVVRSMPNTPAQIGEGITVWTASKETSEAQRTVASQILEALGEAVYVEQENYLDMATALSGTGPAYVFLFMEAMIDAGVHLGFPRRIAKRLVTQTVRGSVDYYQKRDDPVHLARLRNQVTSPGGTSAEALYYLEKAGFRTAISRAIWAAYVRSKELGEGAESHPPESG
jgi:pyrroline-5-carboxylate reductase